MAYFSIVLSQIIGFVIYLLIGMVAVRMRVLGSRSLGVFSRFITKISLPLLLFSNTLNGATRQQFISALPVLAVTVLMYFLLYLLCLFLARLFGLKGNENHVYRACAMFGNIGFMGIAIVAAVFPEQGMLYIALFTVIDQLLLWTLGVNLTAPVDRENAMSVISRLRKMVNPATIAIVLAIVGIFTGIELPAPVNTALTKAGALTTPLAMIYMGGLFCYIDIPRYIRKKEFYGAVAIKMCLFPPLFYMLCQTLGVIHDVTVTMSLLSALPSMAAVVMLAQNQHSAGNYAAGMILVTTLCSIVTLPLVCLGLG
ncbi:AEC family transporter [Megasphaera sp.]|jgi:predicted permease|uniref:AEC family transporter n=1 Tax=Megasphaera sp. TaxID=2023260 RepID=UPI00266EDE42|nr:AEC family transporter [uncultured Megasphaera sp.]